MHSSGDDTDDPSTVGLPKGADPVPSDAKATPSGATGIRSVTRSGTRSAPGSRWWHGHRRWGRWTVANPVAVALWMAGFVGAVALLSSTAARLTTDPGISILESDTATPVLEAQSMLQGHVLLGGWRMLYDSYWTVEVPFYAVGVLLVGVSPILLYVVPAVLAVLLLVTAGVVARQGLRGAAAGVAVGAVIALIGLPSDVWAVLLLHGAWHIGTMLFCLLAFAGLRSGRWRAGWWIALILLTAGLLGDLQTLAYGVGPAAGAGVLATLRTRRWRAGLPAFSAAALSLVAAYLLRQLFNLLGAYTIGGINLPASHEQRWANLGNLPTWIPRVFGVGTGDWGHNGVPAALTAVRYIAVAAVLLALVVAAWSVITGVWRGRRVRTRGDAWRIDDMLLLACVADVAFYIYAAQSGLPGYLRYLAPFVVFGSVLAARVAGRSYAAVSRSSGAVVRRTLVAAAATVTMLFAASFVITSTQPARPVTGADLAAFLTDHHLTNGVGAYWTAAMTTVASRDAVTVRPVIFDGHRIVRYGRQSTADWYRDQQFQFLVFDATDAWGGITMDSVTSALGPPSKVYQVANYRVLTWPEPLTFNPLRFAG